MFSNSNPVWYASLNTCFQFLNNITHVFIHFFTHTYFQKNWKLLFKYTYQTYPQPSSIVNPEDP